MRVLLRRLALAAAAMGIAAGLVTAATFGLFSGAASGQTSHFATGTLSVGAVADSSPCTIAPMAPGDSSSALLFPGTDDSVDSACSYEVKYEGSVPAWVGLTVTTQSSASAPGTEALLDGQPLGLQVVIQDSYGNHFGIGPVSCSGAYPNASSCQSSAPDQLVIKTGSAFTNADKSVNDSWHDTFVVNYALPLASPGVYRAGTAQIVLSAVAVQAPHNPVVGTPPQPLHGWD